MKSKFQLAILGFLHGATWMIFFVFWIMSNYEDGLYDQIVKNTIAADMNDQQKAISLLHETHLLLKPREELFEGEENINLRDALFRSSDIQLIDAKGDCGSYTHVLGLIHGYSFHNHLLHRLVEYLKIEIRHHVNLYFPLLRIILLLASATNEFHVVMILLFAGRSYRQQ